MGNIIEPTSRAGEGLELIRVNKKYQEAGRDRQVLVDADLVVGPGEFTAILGRSGSGKTTLLNLIGGIDYLDSGDLYLDGIHLNKLNDYQRTIYRRQNIGFIFQFFNLIPTLSVWENLIMPLELNGMTTPENLSYAAELLEKVSLSDRMKSFPDRLSGGEQQRVAIARALVHNPLLVLADEPTGNLDEQTGQMVLALLDHLTRQAGKKLVLVTHSTEAASFADKTYRLVDGKFQPVSIQKQ